MSFSVNNDDFNNNVFYHPGQAKYSMLVTIEKQCMCPIQIKNPCWYFA